MRGQPALVVTAVLALAGCYEPPATCGITCTTTCPGDLACVDGVCEATNGTACPLMDLEIARIAVGGRHVCAIATDGALYCWGDNRRGQLGIGSTQAAVPRPTRVAGTWSSISAGTRHTCALREGKPTCWGDNEVNRVGASTNAVFTSPVAVAFGPAATPVFDQLDVGVEHSCAIGAGQLWCWGRRERLGNGNVSTPVATRIGALDDWTSVSTAGTHSCGLSRSAGLLCWGANDRSQVMMPPSSLVDTPTAVPGLPPTLEPIAVEAGSRLTCAILAPAGGLAGELWCWGVSYLIDAQFNSDLPPTRIGNADAWTSISLQEQLACGVLAGRAYCWGPGRYGGSGSGLWADPRTHAEALDLGPADEVDVGHNEFAYVDDYTGCVRTGTELRCWGGNTFGALGLGASSLYLTPVEVASPAGQAWTHVQSGPYHSCASTADGLWCWGSDTEGQISSQARGRIAPCTPDACDAPRPTPAPDAIAAPDDLVVGVDYTCVRTAAAVRCWGTNVWGELGTSTSGDHGVTTVVSPAGPFVSLVGDARASCGGLPSGELACWGRVINVARTTPTLITEPEVRDVQAIGFGSDFGCAVRRDGARVCWGGNGRGQLGDGTTDASSTAIASMTPALRTIAVTEARACGVTTTGQVVCWGQNYAGAGGVEGVDPVLSPTAVQDASDLELAGCTVVDVGSDHSCAICGGAPLCWGLSSYGGLGLGGDDTTSYATAKAQPVAVPPNLTFVEITVTEDGGCALTDAGRLFCWGLSVRGEVGAGGHGVNVPTPIGPAL